MYNTSYGEVKSTLWLSELTMISSFPWLTGSAFSTHNVQMNAKFHLYRPLISTICLHVGSPRLFTDNCAQPTTCSERPPPQVIDTSNGTILSYSYYYHRDTVIPVLAQGSSHNWRAVKSS